MEVTNERVVLRPGAVQERQSWRTSNWRQLKENIARNFMQLGTWVTCSLILLVAGALLYRSWPLLQSYSLSELLLGRDWHPARSLFGFAPFIAGSVAVTLVAMVLAVVPAILTGIYLAEYTTSRRRSMLKPVLDLLVGIPSVVYGLWGILFVVPLIRDHVGPLSDGTLGQIFPFFSRTNPSGYGVLAAGFVLAVMVFPLIVAVTEEVMRSIPREMREAALCLGATRWEATKVIMRRAGLSGILAAVVLGFSRAFGETLAVVMVVGNMVQIPRGLFDAAYPIPALIANNYGEMMSIPLYESALMGASLLLLVIVLCFNIIARLVIVRVSNKEVA